MLITLRERMIIYITSNLSETFIGERKKKPKIHLDK